MVQGDSFNDEELFYLNRITYSLLKKVGSNLKFDKFLKALDTLQNGPYNERIHLWLSAICESEEQVRKVEVNDINLKQDIISMQKFTAVVSASFPQHTTGEHTVDSVVGTLFGKQELMSVVELEKAIKKNSTAHEMISCIIQIDP